MKLEHPVAVACVRYSLSDGLAREDVCYWGDMTFVPHLLNLLTKRRIRAHVTFAPVDGGRTSRKELARHLHTEVDRMRNGTTAVTHP